MSVTRADLNAEQRAHAKTKAKLAEGEEKAARMAEACANDLREMRADMEAAKSRAALDHAEARKAQADAEKAQAEAQRAGARAALEAGKRKDAETDTDKAQQEVRGLRGDLASAQDMAAQIEKRAAEDIRRLQADLVTQKSRVQGLMAQLEKAAGVSDDLRKKLAEAKAEAQEARKQVTAAQRATAKAEADTKAAQSALFDARGDATRQAEHVARLREKMRAAEMAAKSASAAPRDTRPDPRIAQLEAEVSRLERELRRKPAA